MLHRHVGSVLNPIASAMLITLLGHSSGLQGASVTVTLPELGNTAEFDRRLLLEISDDHVSDGPEFGPPSGLGTQAPGDIWSRIRQANRLEQLESSKQPLIGYFRDQYREDALWTAKLLQRSQPWLAFLVEELDKRYLPIELALLPAIESGYQPEVLSSEGAFGIWQLLPGTARDMGLEQNLWFDARADVVTSTKAAIRYLSYLNAEFNGDWALTLAAYNAGLGRVRSAIRRNQRQNKPVDYWSLPLPRETREYVPKLLGLLALLRDENGPGFKLPVIDATMAIEGIDIGFRISLERAARIADVSPQLISRLNAGLTFGVTPPGGPHVIYLPTESIEKFLLSVNESDKQRLYAAPRVYIVQPGDTISGIALSNNLTQRRIRELNALEGSLIRAGQKLALAAPVLSGTHVIDYQVEVGDTLAGIAVRFKVNLGDISQANGQPLATDLIYPGDRLTVTVKDHTAS